MSVLFSNPFWVQTDVFRRIPNASGVTGAGRKVLIMQRRLVRKVLYCSSRCPRSQRRRRADVRTFDASHECFQDWMFQTVILSSRDYILLFDKVIQKTFFFLSSPLKPKRSSTILLFSFFFSRVQHEWICVEKKIRRVFLCWVGRLTIACRIDYLHKGVLDNYGWNGHHDQAHIFLGKRIVIFFSYSFFCLLV